MEQAIIMSPALTAVYERTMSNQILKCPKCQGEMTQGFVPDFSHSAAIVAAWHEGQPRKSFWTRTKVRLRDGVTIGVFRCRGCGFLEFYADPKFAAQ